jgi:hypothetical protein
MSGLHLNSTSDPCSVTGTFGELQVTERCKHVVLDVRSRNYDTTGHLHYEHALARLPLQKALQLRDLLDRAIEASRVTIATAQPGLWSNSAIASVAGKLLRRRQAWVARCWMDLFGSMIISITLSARCNQTHKRLKLAGFVTITQPGLRCKTRLTPPVLGLRGSGHEEDPAPPVVSRDESRAK